MSEASNQRTARICKKCHAHVAIDVEACPACGGALLDAPSLPAESASAGVSQVDHRGIVLPPRHAVGGVITPR